MPNPFFHGDPVPVDLFLDRRRELRRITGRIANRGQSTAVVGEPRSGKTSLLLYLDSAEARAQFYGPAGARLLFSYLDAQALGGQFTPAQFWEYACGPLYERVIVADPDASLAQAYHACREDGFGPFVLERLFGQMGTAGWRLVLVLDEFDVLLNHQVLNSAKFFGCLRSLASRSREALALVVASRRPLADLNKETQQFIGTGSPYFNFLEEITLGPLPDGAIAELLGWAGGRFTAEDRRFIYQVAGGHPYLLQVVAYELWEAYEDGVAHPGQRRHQAWQRLLEEAEQMLGNTWDLWRPALRQVFLSVALAQMDALAQPGVRGEAVVPPDDPPSGERASRHRHLTRLRRLLTEHFDEEEFRTLCFDLSVDYDTLRGEGKAAKARELVAYLDRYDRIDDLVAMGSQMRAHLAWGSMPTVVGENAFAVQRIPPERLRRDFGSELRTLAKQGFVDKSTVVPGGWQVRPAALLWWLAGEAGWINGGALPLVDAVARGAGVG